MFCSNKMWVKKAIMFPVYNEHRQVASHYLAKSNKSERGGTELEELMMWRSLCVIALSTSVDKMEPGWSSGKTTFSQIKARAKVLLDTDNDTYLLHILSHCDSAFIMFYSGHWMFYCESDFSIWTLWRINSSCCLAAFHSFKVLLPATESKGQSEAFWWSINGVLIALFVMTTTAYLSSEGQ